MSTQTKEDNKAAILEKEVKSLQYELKICNEAKTLSEACKNITDHAQEKEEPLLLPTKNQMSFTRSLRVEVVDVTFSSCVSLVCR